MTLTLLLDLDGTLLDNDMDTFVEGYLKAFGNHIHQILDPGIFVAELLSATKKMVLNRLPDQTLEEVFDAAFYPAIKHKKEDLRSIIDTFYREVFPSLNLLTKAKPEAVKLVEEAFERGYRVCIATNPLFPLTAIQQRLEWAGLSAKEYPFHLVSSYESFHFAKPNPAYYSEFLAVIGQPDGPVFMVGNDPIRDIAAAKQAGLATFWLDDGVLTAPQELKSILKSATLQDLLPWLDSVASETISPDYSTADAILANLIGTAAALDTLSRRMPRSLWINKPNPQEWSLVEVICHLRDVETEVNLPRIRKLLQESNPFIPGKDTDPWASERQYILQDCMDALSSFISARLELLSVLENLSPGDWQRPARHAILGPTKIQELVGIIASHDRLHIQQAHQILRAVPQTS
jgi:FMN phosphatase YigB (HAD superfamily)